MVAKISDEQAYNGVARHGEASGCSLGFLTCSYLSAIAIGKTDRQRFC